MSKRELSKIIEIEGRKFKIEKFTAEVGSYILFTLMEKILPLAMEEKIGLDDLPKNRQPISREEFRLLQRDCLGVVREVLPAGDIPIIGENGRWAVLDIEKNTRLVILLTIHALAFNIADFFGGEGLKGLTTSLADIFPANTLMSILTPTPR